MYRYLSPQIVPAKRSLAGGFKPKAVLIEFRPSPFDTGVRCWRFAAIGATEPLIRLITLTNFFS
jgi:hypothetical protein